jgi:hypothetical protein
MGDWPAVTCLCPTYGRFERLRDAVACFLLQDYPGAKNLVIVNDAPWPVGLGPEHGEWECQRRDGVTLLNEAKRYENLGEKRQHLLEMAGGPAALVAHWDDDDLYLPWHLSMLAGWLLVRQAACPERSRGVSCAKPGAAWWAVGPREGFNVRGLRHNVFEGQMLFRRDRARELGGYPPKDSGQARDLLRAFDRAGEAEVWNPPDQDVSYVYRWGDGVDHVSARCTAGGVARDRDFGDGRPLIPDEDAATWAKDRLRGQFRQLVAGCAAHLTGEALTSFTGRLSTAVRVARNPLQEPQQTAY